LRNGGARWNGGGRLAAGYGAVDGGAARAEADPEAEFPADAAISWSNRSRMLTLRLRQSEYDAIQRAAEQRHLPASTLARSLLLDKLGEQLAS
jgi:hypothetical protein